MTAVLEPTDVATCKRRNHPQTPENVYVDKRGHSHCRPCRRITTAERKLGLLGTGHTSRAALLRDYAASAPPGVNPNTYAEALFDVRFRMNGKPVKEG